MRSKLLLLFTCLFAFLGSITAQTSKVAGVVVSADDGQPVIGASVTVKGAKVGTITDMDGAFVLGNLPPEAKTLTISFIGMKSKEIAIEPNMRIVLEANSKMLNEVVVTALGITRDKKSLGYSIQEIKGDNLAKAGELSVGSSLSGKIAGVDITSAGGGIGASQRIVVRGNSSFGDNQPLIVVDGVPVSNDSQSTKYTDASGAASYGLSGGVQDQGSGLDDINPSDIESISVLKGGSASLYGMRAGHGVILITTKKAKNKGVTVNYDASFTLDQVYNLPNYQNKYGQGSGGGEYEYKNSGSSTSYNDWAIKNAFCYVDGKGNGKYDNDDESWGPRLDIGLKIPQYNSPIVNGVRQATDWISHPNNVKDFFETGYSQSHSISIASKKENSVSRYSIGYRNQHGTLPNTDESRYSANLYNDFTINKYLEWNGSLEYVRTESKNLPISGYSANNPVQSLMEWFGRQVDTKDLKAKWNTLDENGNRYNWNQSYHVNPYYNMYKNTNPYKRNRLFGKTSLFIKPTDWLKFEARVGYDYWNTETSNRIAYTTDYPNGYYRQFNRNQSDLNADFIGYFNKNFGKLSINALAGANYRDTQYESEVAGDNDGYGLTISELYTLSNVSGSALAISDHTHVRSNSVYAQASLGWADQVYVDMSLRNDWSSTITQSFFYPSISASWLITNTFPTLKSDEVTYLKLRGGISKVGSATQAYYNKNNYVIESPSINGVTQTRMAYTYASTNLKPEKVVTTEIGFEGSFFNNRLRTDISGYHKVTSDQIMDMEVSKASGVNSTRINAGKISNDGLEFQLSSDIIKNDDGFNWTATINWSKDKSKVEDLYTDPNSGQELSTYTIGNIWSTYVYAIKGQSWGTLKGAGYTYNSDGSILVSNGLPVLSASTKLGNVTPDWLASLQNEFSYKDFSAGFLLAYRKGGDFFSSTAMFASYTGLLDYTAAGNIRENGLVVGQDVLSNKKFKNADGSANTTRVKAQSFYYSYYNNKQLSVYDGSYLKLREAHITYSVPKTFLLKTKFIKAANFSLVGNNLAILWLSKSNKAHIDPESSFGSDNAGVGLEQNSFPPSRSFGFKLGLTF